MPLSLRTLPFSCPPVQGGATDQAKCIPSRRFSSSGCRNNTLLSASRPLRGGVDRNAIPRAQGAPGFESPPSRGRGLKPPARGRSRATAGVAPFAGAWRGLQALDAPADPALASAVAQKARAACLERQGGFLAEAPPSWPSPSPRGPGNMGGPRERRSGRLRAARHDARGRGRDAVQDIDHALRGDGVGPRETLRAGARRMGGDDRPRMGEQAQDRRAQG